jgi:uncharacterized protein YdaU (DUF1376 family)
MAERLPLPLWTDAYLADLPHFDNEMHGAYLQILIFMWPGKALRRA